MNIKVNNLNKTASKRHFLSVKTGEIFAQHPVVIHGIFVDVEFESFLVVDITEGKWLALLSGRFAE
jgi:hypothetical protein